MPVVGFLISRAPGDTPQLLAAFRQGLKDTIHDVRTGDDLPAAFEAGAKEDAEGLIITAESLFVVHRARLTELAARYRLPAIYPYSIQAVDAGGLMAYDVDITDLFQRAASYVDKILKGAKPSDLPVQRPTKSSLSSTSRPRRHSA
jgi:putative ABC transport system substrate-binding protein